MSEPHAGVEALHRAWSEAMARGDVDAVLDLLAPGYVLWAAGRPEMEGGEALRPALTAAFQRFRVEARFDVEARVVDGGLAVERGWDVQVLHAREGGPPREARQRVTLVAREGSDGRWRFQWGMAQPEAGAGG